MKIERRVNQMEYEMCNMALEIFPEYPLIQLLMVREVLRYFYRFIRHDVK